MKITQREVRGDKIGDTNCTCDYMESGLCSECRSGEPMFENEVKLGGCYHSGLAYSLGYDANGVIELTGTTFTNLNIGLNGGAMTALRKHRKQFDPSRDVEQFIVALKPVKVILGRKDDEDYGLGDNPECNDDSLDRDICGDCGEWIENCTCEDDGLFSIYCDYDDEYNNDCIHCGLDPDTCECWNEYDTDEFDQENVADTFHPSREWLRRMAEAEDRCELVAVGGLTTDLARMNAFARARWLKTQGKL